MQPRILITVVHWQFPRHDRRIFSTGALVPFSFDSI